MSQLQLSLLGAPIVKHGERTLTFSTRKALALLVYLAVEGGTHPRKTLSEAFWPELDAEHGRAALRATLLELRKLLERSHAPGERAHLLVERDTLGFDQGSPLLLGLRLGFARFVQLILRYYATIRLPGLVHWRRASSDFPLRSMALPGGLMEKTWDLPVLARGVSVHAQGL